MKKYIAGIATGVLLSCTVALAVNHTATDNPFPVQLNGSPVNIEGYNIDGSTYFKLRDVADTVGGFDVNFENDTISLSTKSTQTFLVEDARKKVADTAGTETAELISEDEHNWYFAPCSNDMLGYMKDSGGHVSPATIIYHVDKSNGNVEKEQTAEPTATPVPTVAPITDKEQEMSKKSLSDVIGGYWQHNSSSIGSYYTIHFSDTSDFVSKDTGHGHVFGKYEVNSNTVSITFYSDIQRTTIEEQYTLTYKNGRLYFDNSDDYLRKMN